MAEEKDEQRALNQRYDQALADASARGAEAAVREFEVAASKSVAVIARSFEATQMLAAGDNQGFGTYYRQIDAETRFPMAEDWDVLRRVADAALFRGYEKNVRFAALSLDRRGLGSYGECSWVLKEEMIAHRSSVFEKNSVLFMEDHEIAMSRAHKLPSGYRATWAERGRLCVAKLAGRIDNTTAAVDYPGLLLRASKTTANDEFVEVHIGGPVTIRTLKCVLVTRGKKSRRRAIRKALREKLENLGVVLEG